MAVVYITEFPYKDWSTTNYDWAKEQIGDDPVDGLIVHTAGFDEDAKVFRIMDVWESSRNKRTHYSRNASGHSLDQGVEALPDPDNAITAPRARRIYELYTPMRESEAQWLAPTAIDRVIRTHAKSPSG